MSDYAEHTTSELVLDLEAGAAVLAREGMHDFPEVLRAAAKRLEKLQGAIDALPAQQVPTVLLQYRSKPPSVGELVDQWQMDGIVDIAQRLAEES